MILYFCSRAITNHEGRIKTMKTSTILAASVLMTTGCVAGNYQTDTFKTKGGKRKKMKKTMKNLQILFYEGVLIVILSLIIYCLSDKPLQGWDVFFTYGFGAAGLLYMVGAKAMPLWLKKQFEKA